MPSVTRVIESIKDLYHFMQDGAEGRNLKFKFKFILFVNI